VAFNVSVVVRLVNQYTANSEKITQSVKKQTRAMGENTRAFLKNKQQMQDWGRSARNTGAIMTAAITLPAALMAKRMTQAASDAEETRTKFETTFKAVRGEAIAMGKTFAKEFGVAESTSQKLLAGTGDLLTGFGFTGDAALDMADRVNRLAADLASFQNLEGGTQRASEALTKALLGETESAKSLGIVIRQNSDEFKNAVKFFQRTKNLTEQQAKAEAALHIALKQSKNAIGDVARTWDSYANQQRRLDEQQRQVSETIGRILLPYMIKLNEAIGKALAWFEALSPATQKLIIGFVAFIAVLGPIIALIGVFMLALPALIVLAKGIAIAFAAAGAVMLAALSPIGIMITALIAGVVLLKKNWIAISDAIGGTIEQIKINFEQFILSNPLISKAFEFAFGAGEKIGGAININVNDPGGNVASVEAAGEGVQLPVGENMSGMGRRRR